MYFIWFEYCKFSEILAIIGIWTNITISQNKFWVEGFVFNQKQRKMRYLNNNNISKHYKHEWIM